MRHRLWVHIVWTTRDRTPDITAGRAGRLAEYLPIIARQERAWIAEVGIVSTHVHLLVRLHPTTQLPRLLQRLKGGSAHDINGRNPGGRALRWAKGYSVTSVSPSDLPRIMTYLRMQHRHHPTEAITT